MPKTYGLSRKERLTRRAEFDRLWKAGQTYRTREVVILALPNEMPYSRLGMVVGRRLGVAARRNRMKRLIREAFRLNKGLLSTPHDVVVIPQPGWTDLRLGSIETHLRRFFERLGKNRPLQPPGET